MTGIDTPPALEELSPIGLDEILRIAELQVRRDRKYLIPADLVPQVLTQADHLRALDIDGRREFRYESLYFDTPDHVSYFDAARRRPHRFKVRTRTYLDSAEAMLEVKVRDRRGNTVKHRQPHDLDDRDRLTEDGQSFIRLMLPNAPVNDLRPSLRTAYRRATIVCGHGAARATVDRDVRWCSPTASTKSLESLALIETKTPGPPCAIDRTLWLLGIRPTTISKYCTGLAAIHPDLPANKWHRVLSDHLDRRGAPNRMTDDDLAQIAAISDRIINHLQGTVDDTVVRRTVEHEYRQFAHRATVHNYLGILTERAALSALGTGTDT